MSDGKRIALFASGKRDKILRAFEQSMRSNGVMSLRRLRLATVPDEIVEFADRITDLDLTHNHLTDLPDVISQLPNLKRLQLDGNPLQRVPGVLFALPNLIGASGVIGFPGAPWTTTLNHYLQNTQRLDPDTRRALYGLVHNGEDHANLTNAQLAAGLLGALPHVLNACLEPLMARSAEAPLTAGARVAVVGSVNFKKTALKKAATQVGAVYQTRPGPDTTHVVLGRSPRQDHLEHLNRANFTFMRPQDGVRFIESVHADSRFLSQPTPEAAAHGENISAMIFSGEKASLDLALALLRKGGVPAEATSALFLVAKVAQDKEVRATARKLLRRHGSNAVQSALDNRSALIYTGKKAERLTTTSLTEYARLAPELDWVKIARALYERNGHGLQFAFTEADSDIRLELLRGHVQRDALDFRSLWSPGSRPYYESEFTYYTGLAVPDDIYKLTELTSLNLSWCHFDTLPPGISALTKLRHLDLSGNMFKTIPDEVFTLPNLRDLRLHMNQLGGFPKGVSQLPNLKQLNIQDNRQQDPDSKHLFNPLQVPQSVRDAMPRVRFLDGMSARRAPF